VQHDCVISHAELILAQTPVKAEVKSCNAFVSPHRRRDDYAAEDDYMRPAIPSANEEPKTLRELEAQLHSVRLPIPAPHHFVLPMTLLAHSC
jgi:hypothetical protein